MSNFRSSLFGLLILVGLLGLTVYAWAQCGGKAGGCATKSVAAKSGCGMQATGAKSGCGMDAAKHGYRPGKTAQARVGDVTVSAAHRRGTTLLALTDKSGRPVTDLVNAKLDGRELALRPVGPGQYTFTGPAAGKLNVSVHSLGKTETATLTLAAGSGCGMAGNCADKAKACACGDDCKCKPGAPAADCKCAGECKCGVKAACGMKAACGTATKAACGTAAKPATAKACGGCAGK